jgi:hypothetical protein
MVAVTLPAYSPDGSTECLVSGGTLRDIIAAPGFPNPPERPTRINFEVRNAQRYGLGLFATADIEPGELILSERPLILVPEYYSMALDQGEMTKFPEMTRVQIVRRWPGYCPPLPWSELPTRTLLTLRDLHCQIIHEWNRDLAALVRRMSPEQRAKFLSLSNDHIAKGAGPFLGVQLTNAWPSDLLELGMAISGWGNLPVSYLAVGDVASRINHR